MNFLRYEVGTCLMNVPDPSKHGYKMSMWPQQAIDAYVEDHYATMGSLLTQTVLTAEQMEKISLLIEERTWLADNLRIQGKYDEAIQLYEKLINMTSLASDDSKLSEKDCWCLSKAFMDYVDCGCFTPKLSTEHLFEVVERGINWLIQISKPDWVAGLQLERGLLLKNQGKLKEAFHQMEEALEKRQRCLDAPGYSLATHKLELAELYCSDIIIHENKDALARAADLVEDVRKAKDSTLNECRLAYLILAEVRRKQGETVAVSDAVREAQRLAYEIERVEAAPSMRKLLSDLYNDAKQVAGVITELDQTLKSIKEQSEPHKNASLRPADTQAQGITPTHISCYVSLPPFDDKDNFYKNVLLPALRKILEFRPYYWQVGYREDILSYRAGKCQNCRVGSNEACWLKCAHVYIADISEWSPDVIFELGYMWCMSRVERRPLIILQQKLPGSDQQDKPGSSNQFTFYHLSDLSRFVVSIPSNFVPRSQQPGNPSKDPYQHDIDDLVDSLRQSFNNKHIIDQLAQIPREHYLSSLWIKDKYSSIEFNIAKAISQEYITMEAFKNTIVGDIVYKIESLYRLKVPIEIVEGIKGEIDDELQRPGG